MEKVLFPGSPKVSGSNREICVNSCDGLGIRTPS